MSQTMIRIAAALGVALWLWHGPAAIAADGEPNGIIVYQSDFGLKDGAVSAMRGVAVSVDPSLRLENLTHEIPAFDIWQGAYRLNRPPPTGRPARCSSR